MYMRKKVIVAIDSFKNCLSSEEANGAVADVLRSMGIEAVPICVSDGGEGMLRAFAPAFGAEITEVAAHDALMRPITAHIGIHNDTAIIETAQASGLQLLSDTTLCPLLATSYGTGELLAHAYARGCRRFIIGLGGSATSDCGLGMLRALIDKLAPQGRLEDLPLKNCSFILASDVRNPLCGPQGAAAVFAPQKGATPEMTEHLERRAKTFARMAARHTGHDEQWRPGAGAAGGLGYAFMQFFGAEARSGAEMLLKAIDFNNLLEDASLVITGEGSADRQTLMGKLPKIVMDHANALHVPVWIVAGKIKDKSQLLKAGFNCAININDVNREGYYQLDKDVALYNLKESIREKIKDL